MGLFAKTNSRLYYVFLEGLRKFDADMVVGAVNNGFDIYEKSIDLDLNLINTLVNNDDIDRIEFLNSILDIDYNHSDDNGICPLFIIVEKTKSIEMFKILREHGMKYFNDSMGVSIIDYLIHKNDYEFAERIVRLAEEEYKEQVEEDSDFELFEDVFAIELSDSIEFAKKYYEKRKAEVTKEYEEEMETIDKLIKKPAMYELSKDIYEDTNELIIASKGNDIKKVKELIKKGINVDFQDNYGYTSLIWAVEKNNYDVAKLLVEAGANVNLKSKPSGSGSAICMSTHEKNDNEALKFVKLLKEAGANLDDTCFDADTCLLYAVQGGLYKTTKYLIENGINIDALVGKPKTSILNHLNFENSNYIDIAKLLIYSGMDLDLLDEDGYPVIVCMALGEGHNDIVELLIKAGADVNCFEANDGTTALIAASANENEELMKMLIKAEVNIDAIDNSENTALTYAAMNGCYNSAKILLENGASTDITNEDGMTAYDIAIKNGYKEIASLISKYEEK